MEPQDVYYSKAEYVETVGEKSKLVFDNGERVRTILTSFSVSLDFDVSGIRE